MAKLAAFPYYGGKYYHAKWIMSLLPKCEHYVEPYCGAAHVALNREPSTVETINDLNGDLINFFVQLRDNPDELIAKLELTLYSRNELTLALQPTDDNLERARRWLVRAMQTFGCMQGDQGWSYVVSMPRNKKANQWLNKIDHLPTIVARLKQLQIESRPALDIIKRYDRPTTLFYCDPPYAHDSRVDKQSYGSYEMADDDHRQLALALHSCVGKVAISGYRCELYDELYVDWQRHDKETTSCVGCSAIGDTKPKRVESLWCNYD